MTLGSQVLARHLGTFLELILPYTSKICNLVCGTRLFPFISLQHWSSTRSYRTFQYFQFKQIWKWIFLVCKELFQVAACRRWSRDHELMMPVWKFWYLTGIYFEHNLFHTPKMWGKVSWNKCVISGIFSNSFEKVSFWSPFRVTYRHFLWSTDSFSSWCV